MSADRLAPASGWGLAVALAAGVAALAASPPLLPADAGAAVHAAFSALCHQLPERSAHGHGVPWALCHRCWGVVAGIVAGLAAAPLLRGRAARALAAVPPVPVLGASLVPLSADWALGALTLWANTPVSRTLTGGLFGLAAGALLAVAFCRFPSPTPTHV